MRHLLKWGYYLKKVSLLIDTYVYYILEYIGTYLNIWGGEAINRMGHLLERNNFSSFLRQLLVWGNYWCEAIYHENPVPRSFKASWNFLLNIYLANRRSLPLFILFLKHKMFTNDTNGQQLCKLDMNIQWRSRLNVETK